VLHVHDDEKDKHKQIAENGKPFSFYARVDYANGDDRGDATQV
jgi:predicted lipoprotein with Yx(FWY)xxD motif